MHLFSTIVVNASEALKPDHMGLSTNEKTVGVYIIMCTITLAYILPYHRLTSQYVVMHHAAYNRNTNAASHNEPRPTPYCRVPPHGAFHAWHDSRCPSFHPD